MGQLLIGVTCTLFVNKLLITQYNVLGIEKNKLNFKEKNKLKYYYNYLIIIYYKILYIIILLIYYIILEKKLNLNLN